MIKYMLGCLLLLSPGLQSQIYHWQPDSSAESVLKRIPPPAGFERVAVDEGSYGHWLRHLPLKKGHPRVMLFNGEAKSNQRAQYAVIDIDVGNRDLQQCADAVMRLRAEFLYSTKAWSNIHFNYTSGDRIDFLRWQNGDRPVVKGNDVSWRSGYTKGKSYPNFKAYLKNVFTYAGTWSLRKELAPIGNLQDIRPGDVFIQGGFPGHAVLVVDVALNPANGDKVFLLCQSYMPAQDIHILKNPADNQLSPWYSINFGEELVTPEWHFKASDLRRFED